VVVRPGEWSVIVSPPLLHVHRNGSRPGALLAVWRHPQLGQWLQELVEPVPARCWQPTSGLRPPVIFTAGASGILIHELIGHMVEADLTCSGLSPLATLAGATITAGSLQVTDDPTRDDLPGAFSCDDEGVVSQPLSVVESGRLCGWLCDRARAEQLNTTPGRGRRPSWNRPPAPRLSNLVVAAGSCSPGDMERDLRHGLVVTRIAGASVDPLSARTVIRVERGWEVRNGRRRRPLARCELTGPALEVLAHIDPVLGDDPAPEWRLGWCMKDGLPMPTGSEAPTLLVHRLEVL
jgi:TldD protein